MAAISVITEQLVEQAVRLSRVPAGLNAAGASLGGAAGAAQGTQAAGEFDGAIRAWKAVIGLQAVATADLAIALACAAIAYCSADKLHGG